MATGDKWQVTASSLNVRSGPGTNYKVVAGLTKGQYIIETDNNNGWIKYSAGWCAASHLKWIASAAVVNGTSNSGPVSDKDKNDYATNTGADTGDDAQSGYIPNTETITDVAGAQEFEDLIGESSSFSNIKSVSGVFGLPYQFLPTADGRISSPTSYQESGLGATYTEKIVGKMPIFFIAPGRPNFMTKYSKNDKKNVLEKLIQTETYLSSVQTKLEDLLSSDGRYYTFDYRINEYFSYVNPMCRIAARYLEIQDFILDGSRLDMIDWGSYISKHSAVTGNYTEYMNIPFYLDSDASVSEGFDNQIGDSSLASSVNGISDLGRELRFLTGYTSAATDANIFQQDADVLSQVENMNDIIEKSLGSSSFLTNLSKHLNTVASGGRMIFPKIWNDSSMSRSYNVKFKFVSPDCNKLSIFLNVLVPLFHLIGLVAPQTVTNNPNGYTNPFIVRSMYKSFFNVDSGIITDMSIEKGGSGLWTVDGIPTSIEVSMTIKDLYDAMSITATNSSDWKYDTLDNTAQMDYIANLCGINMYKPEVGRQLSMWVINNFANRTIDVPRNIWRTINQSIAKGILSIFRSY